MSAHDDAQGGTDHRQPGVDRIGAAGAVRVGASALVGVVAGVTVSLLGSWPTAVLLGWAAAGIVFVTWTWIMIWPMDAPTTARHAVQEEPSRPVADVVLLTTAVASLAAVAVFLAHGAATPVGIDAEAAVSVGSVALSWATVHTIFAVRYARMFYTARVGGVDFNDHDAPRYTDFAYLAFTIGMTFQVSDTDLTTKAIRTTALRHALLSYLFGTVIIATMINLVAGLGR